VLSRQGDISIEILAKLSQYFHIGNTHPSHIGITVIVDGVVDAIVFEDEVSTSGHDRVEMMLSVHLEKR
jgi:hypothetical protein